MKQLLSKLILLFLLFNACKHQDNSGVSTFGVYCEMVANAAKPIALGNPMSGAELDLKWAQYQEVADQYQVEIYRETDFPVSLLFPAELTKDKHVVLIYKGDRLKQYQQYKSDLNAYNGNDPKKLEALARRFGRLLGYTPEGINLLLSKGTSYRNLASFDVKQQITHFYYSDLAEAIDFYENKLGLKKAGESRFQIGEDSFIELHANNESHPEGRAKSVALALLTDQLADWYAYVQAQKIPIKYTYKPKDAGAHDGFVAIDPGGYLLEFEMFKQHPENELFMAVLDQSPEIATTVNKLPFYASITWTYHKDLLKMQQFYEEILGYQMVADQGWTKIYQSSPTGFIGLVDECRGMEDFAESKAVELEWSLSDKSGLDNYASKSWTDFSYADASFKGPDGYIYRISE